MKISIITAVFNSFHTIEDSLRSVMNQTYRNVEHIIIDGGSTDGTLKVVEKYGKNIYNIISEPDRGIYDAMNKGIRAARGDIIGILNSDDLYADESVLETVAKTMSDSNVDSCYGDLVYVERDNTEKVRRYWKSGDFHMKRFRRGWMPPHPTFFVKREVYEKCGLLNIDFPLAADYELMLRFLYKYRISTKYIPQVLVKMRTGGTSEPGMYTVKALLENYRAWKVNGLEPSLITFVLKPLSKISQFNSRRGH